MTGRDEVLPVMLFDDDEAGRKMARDMENGLYQGAKDRILRTGKYLSFADSEIEDLFPSDFLAGVVDRWERRADKPFVDEVEEGRPIVPQIEDWALAQRVTLEERWKVDLARAAKQRALTLGVEKFDEVTLERWTQLFKDFERAN